MFNKNTLNCDKIQVFIGNSESSINSFDGSNINNHMCIIGVGPNSGSFTVEATTQPDEFTFRVYNNKNEPYYINGNLPAKVSGYNMGILHFIPKQQMSNYLVKLSASGMKGKVNGVVYWDGNRAYMKFPPNLDPQNWIPGENKWIIYVGIAACVIVVIVVIYCCFCRSKPKNDSRGQLSNNLYSDGGYNQQYQQAMPPTYGLQP